MTQARQQPVCAELPDAELAEQIRAGAPVAREASEELRRRHLPRTLDHARRYARGEEAAAQLAGQAFVEELKETLRADPPNRSWRYGLLTQVDRAAGGWAAGSRRDLLAERCTAFLDRARGAAPDADRRRAVEAFEALRAAEQCLLWHAVVEQDPAEVVALHADRRPADVARLTARAQDALRGALLSRHLKRNAGCRPFGRILEVAVGRAEVRENSGLKAHMSGCAACTAVLRTLVEFDEHPRRALAGHLLAWGGDTYVEAPAEPGAAQTAEMAEGAGVGPAGLAGPAPSPGAVRAGFVVVVLVGAAVGVGFSFFLRGGGAVPDTATVEPLPPFGDRGTISATAGPVTFPSSFASPTPSSDSPKPAPVPSSTPTTTPSRTPSQGPPTPPPTPAPPGPIQVGVWARLVNGETGLCLDVYGGRMRNDTDVITMPCSTAAPTQQWMLDQGGQLHNRADSRYCLDSRGSHDKGVGVWVCSGENDINLRFLVDAGARLHPVVSPSYVIAPESNSAGSVISFIPPVGTESDQVWYAG
ncbi:RICIN domain-containing protein [Kitasatospora sp. NPDC049258]|uniref:RICIN domain-containing protein n=1 Tax=Kitasatospora sp. NPDC049258 TaxID=3155394 RepID=UPI003442A087